MPIHAHASHPSARRRGLASFLFGGALLVLVGCAGGHAAPPTEPHGESAASDAGSSAPSADAGTVADAAPPMAHDGAEATSFIDAAIDERHDAVLTCVAAARERMHAPHAELAVEIGIDQEGHLIAVQAVKKAKSDRDMLACVQRALTGARFPRSNAGIIKVQKTFSDQAVYR